jgi:FKBP-type peptidyl-prolyl cis-trans isomerase
MMFALLVLGCEAKPAGRDTYSGEPLRAAIHSSCTAELIDENGHACVQVDVFAEGEGEPAVQGEWLTLHYLVEVDGKPLDGSHDGKPLHLKLRESSDVIEGLHLGVEGMRVGERRRVVVPPKLGYRGKKLAGVPPDANLVFFVELVERRETP